MGVLPFTRFPPGALAGLVFFLNRARPGSGKVRAGFILEPVFNHLRRRFSSREFLGLGNDKSSLALFATDLFPAQRLGNSERNPAGGTGDFERHGNHSLWGMEIDFHIRL
jgi:hypothetical protein